MDRDSDLARQRALERALKVGGKLAKELAAKEAEVQRLRNIIDNLDVQLERADEALNEAAAMNEEEGTENDNLTEEFSKLQNKTTKASGDKSD